MSTPTPALPAEGRKLRIREWLFNHQSASIADLAVRFAVTEMTIRRDLDDLAREGHVQRTRGGAVLTDRMVFEFDFRAQRQAERPAKRSIARAAAELVQPGHRLLLDAGTTILELAMCLRDHRDLTVVTTSLAVVSELQFSEGIELVLLGGTIQRGNPAVTGPVTEHCLDLFAVDLLFYGADGIGLDGALYNADVRHAPVFKKMRRYARRTYVLSDSTKVGRTALARNGWLAEVTGLITDDRIDPETLARYRDLGVEVTTVPVEAPE